MGKKIIYFVRHGQTELNARGIRQGPDGPLTDKGKMQALEVARKFPHKKGRPQVIISSPFERTKQTAEIIAKELNMKVEYNDLLVERRNPSEIIGHSGDEAQVRHIVDMIDNAFHDDNLRYSDEENFVDLKARAKKLLRFIRRRGEKRILMVTHGIFLKMVVSYMLLGDKLDASKYNYLSFLNPMDNCGLTICTYTPHWFRKGEWKLLVWNNIAQSNGEDEEE